MWVATFAAAAKQIVKCLFAGRAPGMLWNDGERNNMTALTVLDRRHLIGDTDTAAVSDRLQNVRMRLVVVVAMRRIENAGVALVSTHPCGLDDGHVSKGLQQDSASRSFLVSGPAGLAWSTRPEWSRAVLSFCTCLSTDIKSKNYRHANPRKRPSPTLSGKPKSVVVRGETGMGVLYRDDSKIRLQISS